MFEISAELLVRFIRDPVLAAYAIMGAELDHFQAARLRTYWHVPEVIDSSGWGTGKTVVDFIFINLRCILLPDQRAAVYFPVFQTGKDEFWSYFKRFEEHAVFRAQFLPLKKQDGGENRGAGCWHRYFKNQSEILLPAPGFLNDSQNQASRSFNTLVVEEYTVAASKGDGIDELIGRLRRPCYNMNHPILGNHLLLSAHAEGPEHPGFRYYRAKRKSIQGKSSAESAQRNALISFCYHDWTPKFAKHYRHDHTINTGKSTLSRDGFRMKYLGIWTRSGRGWYSAALLSKILRSHIKIQVYRKNPEEYFFNGTDVAPGQSLKSDSCAFFDWRVSEVPSGNPQEVTLLRAGKWWHVSPCFAHFMKDKTSGQISGFVHSRNRAVNYSKIVLDPGGGGAWVYKEMVKREQLINNVITSVTPLCTKDELNIMDKQPIVTFFKRGSELDKLWHPHFLQSDEGMIEAAHTKYREGFEAQHFLWPQLAGLRSGPELRAMPEYDLYIQREMDKVWDQLTKVRVLADAEGRPKLSKRGFKQFLAKGKKDGAYASLYGFMGVLMWFWELENGEEMNVEDAFLGSESSVE